MNSLDETMLMSLFAHTQQKVIAQEIFESHNLKNPDAIKVALRYAAWQGFIAGLEAAKCYYEDKK